MANTKLARVALADIEGFPFERFVNDFLAAMLGSKFVPLGGVKDGGADGFDEAVRESTERAEVFYQATIEEGVESKVRRTIRRLREFGREPRTLFLVTSKEVKYLDRIEDDLAQELECTIVIRDGGYICSHINDLPQTRAAFWQHLYPLTAHLRDAAHSTVATPPSFSQKSVVYTFLAQEAARREGDAPVVTAMVDALILWGLEGTDPDLGILRTADGLRERIREEVPAVSGIAEAMLDDRLRAMAQKSYPGGRAITWHGGKKAYCLPYATRQRIEEDNIEDENLKLDFEASLRLRAEEAGVSPGDVGNVVKVARGTLRRLYEREAVEFSAFLDDAEPSREYPTVAHAVREVMIEFSMRASVKQRIGPQVLEVLRQVLYESNPQERAYLNRVSRTYALLFSLASHPELSSYFNEVAGHFYLYVGSDVILRALSENLLPAESQVTRGALDAAAKAGATLVLTEPVLEEVLGHFRACDQEHKHHFPITDMVPIEIARNAPHILLRAYLYSRLQQGKAAPKSWRAYVHRFIDYSDLYAQSGYGEMANYLVRSFGMIYVPRSELVGLVNEDEVNSLSLDLSKSKRDTRLADNDALLCLAVYGRRDSNSEYRGGSEFGMATWWLTWEWSILRQTHDLVRKHGSRYIMRPDFLLKFVALSANGAQIAATHASVFSSVLGFSLGRRVPPAAFHALMDQLNEAEMLEPARRAAALSKLVDKIKSDLSREYSVGMGVPMVDVLANVGLEQSADDDSLL